MKQTWLYLLFMAGAAVVLWTAVGFAGSSPLAFAITVVIAGVYLVGALELRRFVADTASMARSLEQVSTHPDAHSWLATVPVSLRAAVKLSLDSGRAFLPGPGLTPYLVGLLVMLGLIGTFIGLVSTLQGAVSAIENSRELDAIRAGMAAPVRGLSMAFGTSVAGVAASAALGLIATLCRQQRARVIQQLGEAMGAQLRPWTVYQRQQDQQQALQTLLEQQRVFQQAGQDAFRLLATDLSTMLREQAIDTASQLTNAVSPVLERSLEGLASRAEITLRRVDEAAVQTQQTLNEALQSQQRSMAEQMTTQVTALLAEMSVQARQQREDHLAGDQARLAHWQQTMEISTSGLLTQWQTHTAEHAAELSNASRTVAENFARLDALLEDTLRVRSEAESGSAARLSALEASIRSALDATRKQASDDLQALSERAALGLNALQSAIGDGLEAPAMRLAGLLQQLCSATDAITAQLQALSDDAQERDRAQLQTSTQQVELMANTAVQLGERLEQQRATLDTVLSTTAQMLGRITEQFEETVGERAEGLSELVAHLQASSTDMASLANAFEVAVERFDASGQSLQALFEQLQGAIENSSRASADQMQYYLAQAREIIDHNLLTQQDILVQWRSLVRGADPEVQTDSSAPASAEPTEIAQNIGVSLAAGLTPTQVEEEGDAESPQAANG